MSTPRMQFGTKTGIRSRLLSIILAAAFLSATAMPALNAPQAWAGDCGAACCRSKKNGCCRKKAASSQFLAASARDCPPQCGRTSTLPWRPLVFPLDSPGVAGIAVSGKPVRIRARFNSHLRSPEFSLRQRPPPAVSPA
ncbi:MAG: hypothetical protein R2729_31120 [Bryobacteraceae bacterium]